MLRALREVARGGVHVLEQADGPLSNCQPQKFLHESEFDVRRGMPIFVALGHLQDHDSVLEPCAISGALFLAGLRSMHEENTVAASSAG